MSPLDAIRLAARAHGARVAMVAHPPDLRWAVGFTGSNGLLVVTPESACFVTDGRYDSQARTEVAGAEVHVPGYDLTGYASRSGWIEQGDIVLIDAAETCVAQLDEWREGFQAATFRAVKAPWAAARAHKSESAIEAMRKALALTEAVFSDLLPLIRPGVRERDLAAEIVYQHLKRGASAMSFEPIVASGPRGALPHARPSSRTLRQGEAVVIDMGGVVDGYAADLTRTVAVGAPPDGFEAVYAAVLEAQERAFETIRAGVSGRAVDAAARNWLSERGYGDYFTHSLGHGVGLEVHEWPRLSHAADDALPAGATVTVEPGVYLPERFGIRIEDVVLVTNSGYERLTQSPRALLVL